MSRGYVLRSRWRLDAPPARVWAALDELLATDDPLAWWPGVTVTDYPGETMDLRVRSRLGYALTVRLSELCLDPPRGLSFRGDGDVTGEGRVGIDGSGTSTIVDIDWRVEARTAWMRRTQSVARPLFVLGHHLVMRRGERHLRRWLTPSRTDRVRDASGG